MLEIGTKAPAFSLPDKDNVIHTLDEFKGKKVILYFYPKDNTAGCTKQACGFTQLKPQFEKRNAVVIGISKDSVKSHGNFFIKQNLDILLLSDVELEAIKAYDVWQEKKLYGKVSMGVVRTTYLINEDGFIETVVSKAKAVDNPQQMLDSL